MLRIPSILKKKVFNMSPRKSISGKVPVAAKKQVKFCLKTTIHEYEKLREISASSSSEES
jgi:hypothetical protein